MSGTHTILIAIWQHGPVHAKNHCSVNINDKRRIRVPRFGVEFPLLLSLPLKSYFYNDSVGLRFVTNAENFVCTN